MRMRMKKAEMDISGGGGVCQRVKMRRGVVLDNTRVLVWWVGHLLLSL